MKAAQGAVRLRTCESKRPSGWSFTFREEARTNSTESVERPDAKTINKSLSNILQDRPVWAVGPRTGPA